MRSSFALFVFAVIATLASSSESSTPTPSPSLTTTLKYEVTTNNETTIAPDTKPGNTSLAVVSSNEVSQNRFTSFMEDDELITAGKESFKVLVKTLRENRGLDEALTVAITTFATSRTANRIRDKTRSSKISLDKDSTDVSKTLGAVALGSLAVIPPYVFPKYFRSMDDNWRNESRQIQKFLTNTLVSASESMMGWVEKSVNELPSFPRLDAQECMKRCICEAHNKPKQYGMTGLVLQLLFPPYTESDTNRVVSKYQLAARYGREDTANCKNQYDGCVVNFLDALNGIFNFVGFSS